MSFPTVTDYDIQALIDNELSREEEKRVRAFLKEDSEARERYEEFVKQKQMLQMWWQEVQS